LENLADQPEHQAVLERMRSELRSWILETRDLGFLPEADMFARAAGDPPYTMARQPDAYPVERVLDAAELVGKTEALQQQVELLQDEDPAVRYWAAVGLHAAGSFNADVKPQLREAMRDVSTALDIEPKTAIFLTFIDIALHDASSAVRIETAGALAELGWNDRASDVLTDELASEDWNAQLQAARTLQLMGEAAKPAFPTMRRQLDHARQHEPTETLAMFVRFALEEALNGHE
jgi:N-sulfoglucosamine sulfohydrolase